MSIWAYVGITFGILICCFAAFGWGWIIIRIMESLFFSGGGGGGGSCGVPEDPEETKQWEREKAMSIYEDSIHGHLSNCFL